MGLGELPPAARLPLLLMGMAALAVGVLAGLARLGLAVPALAGAQAGSHGALMVAAFFGTVIGLERAVALRRPWPYLAPLAAGLGGIALLAGAPGGLAPAAFGLAGAVFVAASVAVYRRLPRIFTFCLLAGAAAWLAGNLVWLAGGAIPAAVPFWMAFLVLTIAGERLELTRFLPPRRFATPLFGGLLAAVAGACLLHPLAPETGSRALAAACLGLAAWLVRYDIARHGIKQQGLTRFTAACLLSGYVWLAAGAALGIAGAFEPGHPWRDAALHAIFVGFVFSMVIGHAPIIFPAVMRVRIPYHPAFYLPLALLHLSLFVRVAGLLAGSPGWQGRGAALNAAALLVFVLTLLGSVVRGRGAAR